MSFASDPIHRTLGRDGQQEVLIPALDAENEATLKAAYDVSIAAIKSEEDPVYGKWTHHSTQQDVEIYTKEMAGSNTTCSKGVGFVDAPPMVISMLMTSPEFRKEYDSQFASGDKVHHYDPYTAITYTAFTAPWPVSGRDFVSLGRSVILPPKDVPGLGDADKGVGAVFTFVKGIVTDKVPEIHGLVRGTLHFHALWVEAVPGNANRSKVIYAIGSDPNGSIPKALANASNTKQPLSIDAIREALKKPELLSAIQAKIASETQKVNEFREKNAAK